MALFVSEKTEIIAAVNADLPREQIPYIDEPDGRAYYEELLAMRDAYGMAAFNLLEDEPDPESDRGWEHEALNMIHMG